jgi:hypothetical protein
MGRPYLLNRKKKDEERSSESARIAEGIVVGAKK